MAFTKNTDDLNIIQALADLPNDTDGLTPAQLKAKFDEAVNLLKTYLNDTLIAELESTTDGSSGADKIGATALNAFSGETVQAILEYLKTQVDNVVLNQVPDESITTAKLARELLDKINEVNINELALILFEEYLKLSSVFGYGRILPDLNERFLVTNNNVNSLFNRFQIQTNATTQETMSVWDDLENVLIGCSTTSTGKIARFSKNNFSLVTEWSKPSIYSMIISYDYGVIVVNSSNSLQKFDMNGVLKYSIPVGMYWTSIIVGDKLIHAETSDEFYFYSLNNSKLFKFKDTGTSFQLLYQKNSNTFYPLFEKAGYLYALNTATNTIVKLLANDATTIVWETSLGYTIAIEKIPYKNHRVGLVYEGYLLLASENYGVYMLNDSTGEFIKMPKRFNGVLEIVLYNNKLHLVSKGSSDFYYEVYSFGKLLTY